MEIVKKLNIVNVKKIQIKMKGIIKRVKCFPNSTALDLAREFMRKVKIDPKNKDYYLKIPGRNISNFFTIAYNNKILFSLFLLF